MSAKHTQIAKATLLEIYRTRSDLRNAFPEAERGSILRLLEWCFAFGMRIDSARPALLPHFDRYREMLQLLNPKAKPPEACDFATSIWDNSREQYIPNGFKTYWETLTQIGRYQSECLTGDANYDSLDFIIDMVKTMNSEQPLRCAFVGCLEIGHPEVIFSRTRLFQEISVFDIASGLLERQAECAAEKGLSNIRYVRADMNSYVWPEHGFDVIVGWGTVHHIERLEHFFSQVSRSLRPRGFVFLREYVGPNRIQFTDAQLALTNAILRLLPEKYRTAPAGLFEPIPPRANRGTTKNRLLDRLKRKDAGEADSASVADARGAIASLKLSQARPSLDAIIAADPSESTRSQDILSVMREHLAIEKVIPTGGTLLHPLLNGIAGNFDADADGERCLAGLIDLEKVIIRSGLLPSDFVFVIGRRQIT